MGDLGPAVGALLEVFAPLLKPLARVAARTLFGTVVGLGLIGVGTLYGAWVLGARGGAVHGLIALAVALALMAVLVPIIAMKRAVGKALLHALSTMGVGKKLMTLFFDGLLQMSHEGAAGTRGSLAQKGVERLPLVEIERRAKALVARVTGAGEGFIASRVRRALLEKVATLTLEELRAEGERAGGVDLVQVRARVEEAVERKIVARIAGALRTTTMLLGLALFGGSLGAAYLIGR